MVDLTTRTIRNLFEKQVRDLTERTIMTKEDTFDFQMSGGVVCMNIKQRISMLLEKYDQPIEFKQTYLDDFPTMHGF